MVVLVFYGGAGINIISYCCNECRSKGIEVLQNHTCNDIHHHHHADAFMFQATTDDNENSYVTANTFHATSDCSDKMCNKHEADNPPDYKIDHCAFCDDHSSEECSLERINFYWSSYKLSKQETNLFPEHFTLFSCNLLNYNSLDIISNGDNITSAPHRPPPVLPRDYLSILTVLLI